MIVWMTCVNVSWIQSYQASNWRDSSGSLAIELFSSTLVHADDIGVVEVSWERVLDKSRTQKLEAAQIGSFPKL